MRKFVDTNRALIDPPSAGGGDHFPIATLFALVRGGSKMTAAACGIVFDPVRRAHVRVWTVSFGQDTGQDKGFPGRKLLGVAFTVVNADDPNAERNEIAARTIEMANDIAEEVEIESRQHGFGRGLQ
ncbi:hypothetical protein [Mesorhizobium sp.]|uniref:hypothetical protein n=1 Tax=Mesorhizobium sp. TaxID=1871066 RepID=UPI000FE59369|nr:hypothetical protein [Mesorhizobium sp.]RWQ16128.1 MAG: hypothetical protein EOR93_23910 [Mesorhizobium sp.]